MKTFDTASFSLNAEQQAMLDELYPIINEEFKADNGIISAYHKAQTQPNTKLAFVSYINPLVIQMAHALGSTLNIPLAAIISRTIANEWLEETKTFDPAKPLNEIMDRADAEAKAVLALPAEVVKVESTSQDEYLTGIENRAPSIYGWSVDPVTPLNGNIDIAKVAVQDEPIIPTSVPRKSLARGSAGQDRSKPVLTVAVLRGLHELLSNELHPNPMHQGFKGRPDARLAVKYLQRLAAWGDKRESSKEK